MVSMPPCSGSTAYTGSWAALDCSAWGLGPGQCYRKLGTPVTITSAAVSYQPTIPPGGSPGAAALLITLPTTDVAALTAATTTVYDYHGPPHSHVRAGFPHGFLDISVGDKTG